WELSPTTFRRIAGATVFALWLIVSTGAIVRLTSSGLGCEHWPGCQPGQPFPEKDYHSFIEFGNRLVGGVTIALTLALAIGAWRTPGLPRRTRRLALGTFLGTLAQAPLGALTVYAHLHPALVIPHLLLSMAVLAGAIVVGLEALGLGRERGRPLDREQRLAGLGIAAACFALLATGTLATAPRPHSGGKHVYRPARRFAEIDPEGFYDFQATRPHVKLEEGFTRRIDWPETVFYHARPDGMDRDAVLLLGVEPNLRWRTFSGLIVDFARELGVELVV